MKGGRIKLQLTCNHCSLVNGAKMWPCEELIKRVEIANWSHYLSRKILNKVLQASKLVHERKGGHTVKGKDVLMRHQLSPAYFFLNVQCLYFSKKNELF